MTTTDINAAVASARKICADGSPAACVQAAFDIARIRLKADYGGYRAQKHLAEMLGLNAIAALAELMEIMAYFCESGGRVAFVDASDDLARPRPMERETLKN